MKLITEIEEIEGKTIKSASFVDGFDRLVILFNDESYVMFKPVIHYDDCDLEIDDNPCYYHKYLAGIISHDEYSEIEGRAHKAALLAMEEKELAELARLQVKYEGKI
jgi:hypothetical protein